MTFAWPVLLPALLLVPLLTFGYVVAFRRRKRTAVVFSSVALIRVAAPSGPSWRRHIPAGALLAALAFLLLAAARPQAQVDVPVAGSSVIVAIDVSGSMCATDVTPNRLSAAQNAVREFVQRQDKNTRIGLVAFAGFAELAVPPTTKHKELLSAIDGLTTGRGTTIGSAIMKSVDAISAINPSVAPAADPAPEAKGTKPGSYAPEIVVLLTDGANTQGVPPSDAAKVAAARGVRVYPIGFGTTNPTQMVCTAQQLGGSGFENQSPGLGRGAPQAGGFLVADEPTLREVASVTGGTYFAAQDAGQLQNVLKDLPRHVQLQHRNVEVSAWLAGIAVLLVLGAVGAAARWTAFPS